VGPAAVILWIAVLACAGWACVRVLGLDRGFPVVPLIAYTPYVAVLAALVAAAALLAGRWVAAAIVVASTLALVVAVLPRALHGPGSVEGEGLELTVTSANLALGEADAAELTAIVRERGTDLLSIQELTPGAARSLREAGIEALLPERVLAVGPESTGAGLYSRYPLRRLRRTSFGIAAVPMPQAEARVPGARPLEIAAVHPNPPIGPPEVDLWREGLRSLPAGSEASPRILAGDFNATLDHAEMGRVLDAGYRDAADAVGAGLVATWRSGQPLLPPLTIDHVLVGPGIGVQEFGADDLAESDHRAVTAEVEIPAAAR
jgi:endonuclease/exonuclease/phosphatase family metal-dependent hydrolase